MTRHSWPLLVATSVAFAALAACGTNDTDYFGGLKSGSDADDGGSGEGATAAQAAEAEKLFRAVEGQLTTTCGGTNGQCHVKGTYAMNPPTFLAPPDAYVSIKAFPGTIVADPTTSIIINHGQHDGPPVKDGPFKDALLLWLNAEADILLEKKLPTIAPVTVVNGANDIDLSAATSSGAALAVHLKFSASLVAGVLSLGTVQLTVPAGTAVHFVKPHFIRVTGKTETPDPADSFSNVDQVFPGGATTTLPPGTVLFAGDGWTPFVLGTDQIRIELEKLEPGTLSTAVVTACKDPAKFGTAVLPAMRATMAANGVCSSCHGGGQEPNMGGTDVASICIGILERLDRTNLANSKMITHVTMAGHTGGLVQNATTWKALFTNNQAVFF